MSIKRSQSNQRMSQSVTHGNTLYLAGQVAADAEGGTMTEQTQNVLDRVDNLLTAAGTDKSKLLTATIWITSMADFAEMNAVWDAWVSPGNPPCRACVEANLAKPSFIVEVMVTAALD